MIEQLRARYSLRAYRNHWMAASAVVAMVMALGATIVIWLLPTTHTSSAALSVRSSPGTTLSADELRLVAHEYAIYLASGAVSDSVAKDVGVPSRRVRDATTVSIDPDSVVIRVDVTEDHRRRAVTLANDIAAEGHQRARGDDTVVVTTLASATVGATTAGPPRRAYLALSWAAIAVLLASWLYLLRGWSA